MAGISERFTCSKTGLISPEKWVSAQNQGDIISIRSIISSSA
jgi:hypothetical protein